MLHYYDYEELISKVLGCEFNDETADEELFTMAEDRLDDLADSSELDCVRSWVIQFYEKHGNDMHEAPVWKGLIEIEDDFVYNRVLVQLMPILWR